MKLHPIKGFINIFSFCFFFTSLISCSGGGSNSNDNPATSLHIENPQNTLTREQKTSLRAYLLSIDGKKTDVTQQADWTTNNPEIVSIDRHGSITAKNEGSCEITAGFQAKYATTRINVTSSVVERIEIQPTNSNIHIGEELQYHATGFYSDNSVIDLTDAVEWKAANDKIVSIDTQGLAKSLSAGSTEIIEKERSTKKVNTTTITVNSAPLQNLDILPRQASIGIGVSKKLLVKATFADGDEKNISDEATWQSANIKIATVDSTGLVTGQSVGRTTVQATFGGQTQTSHIQVVRKELRAIHISPQNIRLPQGLTTQLEAFAIYTDEDQENITSNAHWSTEDQNIVTLKTAAQAIGISLGSTRIQAHFDGKIGETSIDVTHPSLRSMGIYPNSQDQDFTIGMKKQLSVKGIYNNNDIIDMTQNVTWISQYPDILSIIPIGKDAGLAEGRGEGVAKVTAFDHSSKQSTSMTYQVKGVPLESIRITPADASVPEMNILPVTATGHFSDGKDRDITDNVFWVSSNPRVANISQQGSVMTKAAGITTISARYEQKASSVKLNVVDAEQVKEIIISPSKATIRPISGIQFKAIARFNNGRTLDITETGDWSSTKPYIASIWHTPWLHGQAWAWRVGTTEISITYKETTATVSLTVAR